MPTFSMGFLYAVMFFTGLQWIVSLFTGLTGGVKRDGNVITAEMCLVRAFWSLVYFIFAVCVYNGVY